MQTNSEKNNGISFITLSARQLEDMLQRAARLGASLALTSSGVSVNDLKTRAEMNRLHGKARVQHLISEGKLTPRRVAGEKRMRYSETEYQSLIL